MFPLVESVLSGARPLHDNSALHAQFINPIRFLVARDGVARLHGAYTTLSGTGAFIQVGRDLWRGTNSPRDAVA